ncbi:MAG: AraC family transcriptional regulator [Opitutaceae bacterium]|nr:AraC family transcriptional regulator [Opitutaceae bacterium]
MPDLTPSQDTNKDSLAAAAVAPAGKSIEAWLIPGRGVSVQIGARTSDESPTSCAQTRILALLDASAWCEISHQTPDGAWRKQRFEGPKVIVIGAWVSHLLSWSSDDHVATLLLEPRFVHETAKAEIGGVTTGDVTLLGRRAALIVQSADALRSFCRGEKRPTALYVECIGTVLATHVLHSLFDGEAPIDRRGGLPIEALQRVIAHIDAHYHEDYDLTALARIAGFSRNHFCRLFEKSLAQTPRAYFRGCQVEHAIVLLQTTDLKAIDIATQCGFCDQTQMARWFWELRHTIPSEVRDAARP